MTSSSNSFHPIMDSSISTSWIGEDCKPLLNALGRLLVADGELLPGRKLRRFDDPIEGFAQQSPAWRRSRDAVVKMSAFCREREVEFVVAVLPSFVSPFGESYPYWLVHERVLEWGAQHGFACVDLLSAFTQRDPIALVVPGDGHPNAEGHRLIAEALVEHVPL